MQGAGPKLAAEAWTGSPVLQSNDEVLPLDTAVAEVEKATILAALEKCNHHRERTAQLLGISVRTLHYKMNRYSLQ
jgi:DNA-binding NtrC family response regulator